MDTRKLASFAFVAFLLGGALGGALFNYGGVYVPTSDLSNVFGYMKQFQSYDELKSFLNERESDYYGWNMPFFSRGIGMEMLTLEAGIAESVDFADAADGEALGAQGSNDYSGTNIQVEGVDEAEIVKTDGMFIYFAKGSEVIIVRAYPVSEAEVVSRINMTNTVQDIYISGDRLIIFTAQFPDHFYYYEYDKPIQNEYRSILSIYDISDRSVPEEIREINMDGTYFNSRLIGNHLHPSDLEPQ